jgi:hypothetical protein
MASYSDHPRRRSSWSTPTPTELDVLTHAGSPPVTSCSWAPTSCPAPPSDSLSSVAPVLRPSTAPWPTAWQRPPGYDSSSTSYTVPSNAPPSSTSTTSAQSTSPLIPYSISARSMCVTPQVFIFRSTTSMDLNTKYQWMKHMLNFNYLRPSRYRICFVGHEFDIVFIYPGSS